MAKNQVVLLDTNILIGILRKNQKVIGTFSALNWDDLFISTITYGEIIIGARKWELQKTKRFLKSFGIIELDKNISVRLRQIYHQAYYHQGLLADAIIGATAVTYDLPLWTTNKIDFNYISGLRFFKP